MVARNSPKTTKEVWLKIQSDYHSGNYKSVRELAERFGIHKDTLHSRITKEKWNEKRSALLLRVNQKVEEKTLSQAEQYLSSSFLRAKKYEKMIDASQENLGSKTPEGIPLLDPEALDVFTRSELRIHELAKSSLRIAPISQLDITSQGQQIGGNLVAAIEKLRNSGNLPDISPEIYQAALNTNSDTNT